MPVLTAQELEEFLISLFPRVRERGLKVEMVDAHNIRLRLPHHDDHLRPGGTVSGPTQMMLCDTAMYLVTLAQIGPVAAAVTTSLNINFLRKPGQSDLIAEGKLLKLGKRLAVGDVTLFSEGQEEPVAQATVTYSIPPH
jgi:uncharacterized protein (TIGR00369 family)